MANLKNDGQKNLVMTSQNSQNEKPSSSSTHVKHLTKSEIRSLQESKAEAYHLMMTLN